MSRQYLLATLPAPVTPKCRGIVSGRKESSPFSFIILSTMQPARSHIDNIITTII